MYRARLLLLACLIITAASVSTPYAQEREAGPGVLPKNPFCLVGACGYGRDGIPDPYAGRGISGRAARAYASSGLQSFPSSRTTMLSWLTSTDIAGSPMNSSDIWGYTSPSGREYAIVGLLHGTAFVEISDPTNPAVVGVVAGAASDWRDMAVYREYAYSVNESGNGLQVIDLTRIDQGEVTLATEIFDGGLHTAHNVFVNEDSGHAYMLGSNLARGGLLAADLADPASPVIEPVAWDLAYVHDVLVVTYDKGKYAGREIAFAFTGPFGLHIIDVTDKAAPLTISHLRYEGATYGHSGALSPNRRLLYVNDELDERVGTTDRRMTTYVVRVGNLENPRLVKTRRWKISAIDHNSMVQGNKLFLSAYRGGLRIFDISKARRPKDYGYFDTYPANDLTAFTGAWGVFAGFASGNVIVSDIERGLFIIRAD